MSGHNDDNCRSQSPVVLSCSFFWTMVHTENKVVDQHPLTRALTRALTRTTTKTTIKTTRITMRTMAQHQAKLVIIIYHPVY